MKRSVFINYFSSSFPRLLVFLFNKKKMVRKIVCSSTCFCSCMFLLQTFASSERHSWFGHEFHPECRIHSGISPSLSLAPYTRFRLSRNLSCLLLDDFFFVFFSLYPIEAFVQTTILSIEAIGDNMFICIWFIFGCFFFFFSLRVYALVRGEKMKREEFGKC